MSSKNQQSEDRDFNRMQAVEWARCNKSAAKYYMDLWKEQDAAEKEFQETGFNGLFLP